MRLLFIGDVVGKPGREGLAAAMPGLRAERMPDLIVVNGENAAGGVGITEETAAQIFEAGADVITLGNHTYRHKDVYSYLDSETRIIRPANFSPQNPGRGHTIVEAAGMRVAVINLSGRCICRSSATCSLRSRFSPRWLVQRTPSSSITAEPTSEKAMMGWHLDGRVAAVLAPTPTCRRPTSGSPGGTLHR
jgi:calcineurin-like phosphoesterase